jgi:hypothetical protein
VDRRPVPGQFRQPTDVAWDTDGNIYISDGYINSRVTKFTPDVARLLAPDAAPGSATMAPGAPWAVCITPPNAQGQQFLYSSDAFPGRVYKLTLDGKVLGWVDALKRNCGRRRSTCSIIRTLARRSPRSGTVPLA